VSEVCRGSSLPVDADDESVWVGLESWVLSWRVCLEVDSDSWGLSRSNTVVRVRGDGGGAGAEAVERRE